MYICIYLTQIFQKTHTQTHTPLLYLLVLLEFLLFLLQDQNGPINLFKLPGPRSVVQEGPEIEPVVIGAVRFCVVGWRESRHLMPVDRVVKEEPLYLHRNLCVQIAVGEKKKKKNGARRA